MTAPIELQFLSQPTYLLNILNRLEVKNYVFIHSQKVAQATFNMMQQVPRQHDLRD